MARSRSRRRGRKSELDGPEHRQAVEVVRAQLGAAIEPHLDTSAIFYAAVEAAFAPLAPQLVSNSYVPRGQLALTPVPDPTPAEQDLRERLLAAAAATPRPDGLQVDIDVSPIVIFTHPDTGARLRGVVVWTETILAGGPTFYAAR